MSAITAGVAVAPRAAVASPTTVIASPPTEVAAIALPATLEIAAAGALRDLLAGARSSASAAVTFDVRVDGALVQETDTAGIQLLCAAAADTRRAGGRFELLAPSPALRAAAQLLGVDSLLGLTHGVTP